MTKEIWSTLSEQDKKKQIREWLQQVADIDHGRHQLSGSKEQGKLSAVKKDLETLIIKTLEWEKPTK